MTGIEKLFENKGLQKAGKVLYVVLLLGFTMAFIHPDLMETANHSYLLLDSIFRGRFLDFYTDVLAHGNDFYYINAAHYNIAVYLVFAVWELPVYCINRLFSLPVNEPVLWQWMGMLCSGLLVICAWQMGKLAAALGEEESRRTPWLFLLSPIPFLLASFGFYDLPAVLLMLFALRCYLKGDMMRFSLLMGCAALFKVFALLVFAPLLLLACKKLLREWIPCGVLAVLPYGVTSLLFSGRSGDVDIFMDQIIERFLATTIGFVPLLLGTIALLSVWCYLRPAPETPAQRLRGAASCGLIVFGALLLFMVWHPQWAIFLFPFYIFAVVSQRNRRLYDYLSPVLSGCILLYMYAIFPGKFEANLMVWGAAYFARFQPVLTWNELPSVFVLMERYVPSNLLSTLFAAVLACILLFRFDPGSGEPLADRNVPEAQPLSVPRAAAGFGLVIAFYLLCLMLSFFVINR